MGRTAPQAGAAKTKAGRGCLFWALAALGLITLVIVGSVGIGVYLVRSDLSRFSSAKPMDVPLYRPSERELEAARKKIERIERIEELGRPDEPGEEADAEAADVDGAAVDEESPEDPDAPPPPVVLAADDLNSLIASSPQAKKYKLPGRVHVRGADDRMLVDINWPLDEIPTDSATAPWLRFLFPLIDDEAGRYFSGTFTIGVAFDEGEVAVELEKGISPEGKELSDRMLGLLSDVITRRVNDQCASVLRKLENLEIRDGKIYLEQERLPQ